jgi:hypothetical protein
MKDKHINILLYIHLCKRYYYILHTVTYKIRKMNNNLKIYIIHLISNNSNNLLNK